MSILTSQITVQAYYHLTKDCLLIAILFIDKKAY